MRLLFNIGMILKSMIVAVGKFLHLLLIRLYLSIPALYVLAIWIASVTVPFSLGDYTSFLVIGATLCSALSALLVLRRAVLAPSKKKQRNSTVQTFGSMETGSVQPPASAYVYPQYVMPPTYAAPYPPPMPQSPPYAYGQPVQAYPQGPPPTFSPQSNLPPLSATDFSAPPPMQMSRYAEPQREVSRRESRFEAQKPAPEKPRYFRTKRDPSLFIAEYSDRLEYFRRMEDGSYRLIDTELKQ